MRQTKKVLKKKMGVRQPTSEERIAQKDGLGSVVYRVASPTGVPALGSQRFWCLANQNTRSLAKLSPNDPVAENIPPWKKASRELNEKLEAEKRLQLYNTPYSFLTSIGGRTATIGQPIPHKCQPEQKKKQLKRIKSAKCVPRKDHTMAEDDLLIPTDPDGSDFWHKQLAKHCGASEAKDPNSKQRNMQQNSKPPSANPTARDWSTLRPVTAKPNNMKSLTRENLPALKQKITQIRVKPINDLTYHSPVEKIGVNMQVLALFTYDHLSKLKQGDLANKKYLPLQYAISGVSTTTSNTIDNNNSVPIKLCIFPEYFDSNPHKSAQMRTFYLESLMKVMGDTYDPEILAAIYKEPLATETDWKILRTHMTQVNSQCISPYNYIWIEHSIKDLDEKMVDEEVFKRCIREIWQGYEQSQRMAIACYKLLTPVEKQRSGLKVLPHLYRTNQQKIVKSGGYSQLLFTHWSYYVQNSRRLLQQNLLKYNPSNLALRKWFEDFNGVQLLELELTAALSLEGYYLDLDVFAAIQLQHFEDREELLRHIWFRGALSIALLGRYLYSGRNPWRELLINHTQDYRLVYHDQTNNYYKNRPASVIYEQLYSSFLKISIPEEWTALHCNLSTVVPEQSEREHHERPTLASCSQILFTELYELINANLSKFEKFIGDFVQAEAPLFKLNLSVRNDLLVYNHSQKEVLALFRNLLQQLLKISFQGADVIMDQSKTQLLENSSRYLKYLPFVVVRQVPSRLVLKVSWLNPQTFQPRVDRLLTTIAECYDSCSTTIRMFESFQPLVRRPDLTFDFLSADFDEEAYSYEAFLKHTDELRSYQRRISDLEDGYNYSLFHINVLPVKGFLNEKINEMLYLAQKKYKRILFRDIHLVEGAANDLSQKLLSGNKTAEQLSQAEHLLETIKSTLLPQLRYNCNTTINIILSYIGTMDSRNASDSVLSVLQAKLSYVYKLPRSIQELIEGIVEKKHQKERFTLQSDLKDTIRDAGESLNRIKQAIDGELMNYAYLHSKLSYYNECLNVFEQSMKELGSGLECLSRDHFLLFKEDSDQILILQRQFLEVEKVGKSLAGFWRNAYKFDQHIRSINKLEVRDLASEEYQKIVVQCKARAGQLTTELPASATYKKYLNQFKEELAPYERAKQLLKLLSSKLLTQNHYCWLPNPRWPLLPVRTFVEEWQQISEHQSYRLHQQVKKVCQMSMIEHHVRTVVETSADSLSTLRMKIVAGPGEVDIVEWQEELSKLDQLQFQVRSAATVMSSHKNENIGDVHLQKQLRELLNTIGEVLTMTRKLYNIQRDYLSIEGLFSMKDLRYLNSDRERFQLIQQIWSDLMKSITVSGSLTELPDRKETKVHLNKAEELLEEVRANLGYVQDKLCQQHPRLYFIDRELLFEVMCRYNEELVQKAVLSCFPEWKELQFCSGKIVSIGSRYALVLDSPTEVRSRFSQVELWMKELENSVRRQLQLLFTSLLIDSQQKQEWLESTIYPEQLKVLMLWLNFTKSVEQAIEGRSLSTLLEDLSADLKRQHKPRNIGITKVTYIEIVRELIAKDVQSVTSGVWQDKPRFYHRHQHTYLQIAERQFEYAFNYIDQLELPLLDHQKFGKCLVSQSSSGKITRVFNIAQLLSIQLRVVNVKDSYEVLDKLLKGCTRCKVWLLVAHIMRQPQEHVALLYHHLRASKMSRKQAKTFQCFFTLSQDEVYFASQNEMVKTLLNEEPVRLAASPIPRLIRLHLELIGLHSISSSLGLLFECLQYSFPDLANMKLVKAFVNRFMDARDDQNIQRQLENILYEVFSEKPHQQLIHAFFMREQLPSWHTRTLAETTTRHQIVYGETYFSRKTSTVRETYGSDQVVVLYCRHLGIQKLKEQLSSIPSSKVVLLDRGLYLYNQLKQQLALRQVRCIFEESTIHEHEPSTLIECNLAHLRTTPEEIILPDRLEKFQSAFEAIEYRLGLKHNLNSARRQFRLLLRRLLTEVAFDAVSCMVYSLIWGYSCFTDRSLLRDAIKQELLRFKQIKNLQLGGNLDEMVMESGILEVCQQPQFICFGGEWSVLEVGSVYRNQLSFLSQYLDCGIFVDGTQFLTSHLKSSKRLYVACSRYTTLNSFFNQFEAACLERTAQRGHYVPKWLPDQRVVIDDVHLPPLDVVDCISEMVTEGTMVGRIVEPYLRVSWMLAAKPSKVSGPALSRIRRRMFVVDIPDEHCQNIFMSIGKTVFRHSSNIILEAAKQIENYCASSGSSWWKPSANKLFSTLYLQNSINGLPKSLRAKISGLLPKVEVHALGSKLCSPIDTIDKPTILSYLQQEQENLLVAQLLPTELFLEQVRTVCLHLSHHQNLLLVGGACTGKATATVLSTLLLKKSISFGNEGKESICSDIRFVREGEFDHEEVQYQLKNLSQPPWNTDGTGETSRQQWVICVNNLDAYESWLPWATSVYFEAPSKESLLMMCSWSLPKDLLPEVNSVLLQLGICKDMRSASYFNRLVKTYFARNSDRVSELKRVSLTCKGRIESLSPTNTTLVEQQLTKLIEAARQLEDQLYRKQQASRSLAEQLESQVSRIRILEETKLRVERQLAIAKDSSNQQLSTLENRLLKYQAKLLPADCKSLTKTYNEVMNRLLKKPLESSSQLRQYSRQEPNREDFAYLKQFLDDKLHQPKSAGPTKTVYEWLCALSERYRLQYGDIDAADTSDSAILKEHQECLELLTEATQAAGITESGLSSLAISIRQNKDQLEENNKQMHLMQLRCERSKELWSHFQRYDIALRLRDEAELLEASVGDVLLICCLLSGVNECSSKARLNTAGLNVSDHFGLAAMIYGSNKCKRCCKKFNLEEDALNRLVATAHCPSTVLVVDRMGVVNRMQEVLDFLKQGEFDIIEAPTQRAECLKFIRKEFQRECYFDQRRLLIIPDERLLEDVQLVRIIKNEAEIPNVKLLFVAQSITPCDHRIQRYLVTVSHVQSSKDVSSETERALLSIRQAVIYSSLTALKQSILEQQETMETRSHQLLSYLNNLSLSLTDYEDIYTMILGLVEELASVQSTLNLNMDKLRTKEEEVRHKYGKVLRLCRIVYQAYRFLEKVEPEFHASNWKEVFLESVKPLKKVGSIQQFQQQLEEQLSEKLLVSIQAQTTQQSRVLMLSYIRLALEDIPEHEIQCMLNTPELEGLEKKLHRRHGRLLSQFKKLAEVQIEDLRAVLMNPNVDRRLLVTAFLSPYELLSQVAERLQDSADKEFTFYSPSPLGEECSRVLREAWRKGQWLFVFNVHLHRRFLSELSMMLRNHRNDPHKDFRVWLTFEPQGHNILPEGCLSVVGYSMQPKCAAISENTPPTPVARNSSKAMFGVDGIAIRMDALPNPSGYVMDWLVKFSIRTRVALSKLVLQAGPFIQRPRQSLSINKHSQLVLQLREGCALDNSKGSLLLDITATATAYEQPSWICFLRRLSELK